ncbi:MAG: nucleotide exchange factor GrpE [Pseudomonadota bacterium]
MSGKRIKVKIDDRDTPEAGGESPVGGNGEEAAMKKPLYRVADKRHWAAGDEADDGDGDEPDRKPAHVEMLEQQLREKDEKLEQTIESYRKVSEEYEASKIRLRRDAAKEIEKGRHAVLAEILGVIDNFDRALEAAKENRDFDSFLEGIELIRTQMLEKMSNFDVRRMEAMGRKFDPAVHNVVTQVPVDDPHRDGVVVGVISEGYFVGDTLLRPATVAVGKCEEKP